MKSRNLVLFAAIITSVLLLAPLNHQEKHANVRHQLAQQCVPVTPIHSGTLLFPDGSGPVPPPPTQDTTVSMADGSGPVPPPPSQLETGLLADGSGPVPPPPTQPNARLDVVRL